MADISDVQERILFNRRILVGKTKATSYDPIRHNVYLEAEIKEHHRPQKRNTDLKEIKGYKTFSISGTSKNFGGQIQDELTEDNIDFVIPKERVQHIKNVWKTWHLNNLKAGTLKQERALKRWKGRPKGWSYDQDLLHLQKKNLLVDKGYKYGSDWLVEDLPTRVEKKIRSLF